MVDKLISKDFREKLQNEVKRIENVSSVEVVSVLLPRASQYRLLHQSYSFMAALCSALWMLYLEPSWESWQILGLPLGVFVLSYLLLSWPTLLVRLVPRAYRLMKVEARAKNEFMSHEVFSTRDRTGLLILICLKERACYLLADKGLCQKIPEVRWQEVSRKLAADFNHKKPGDSFLSAMEQMEEELSRLFPRREDDKNELADHLRH